MRRRPLLFDLYAEELGKKKPDALWRTDKDDFHINSDCKPKFTFYMFLSG
jgi:hypothetical protein